MEQTTAPTHSKRYASYVLLVLTGVYTFNFIDRQILVILQEPIKADLGLSDTQLGLLTGLSFAIFYVVLGIPIARWADKGNRKNIVSISLVVWSAMTAVSGLAANFFQLLLARIGVGVGEAGGSPPSHSIISDYYPPEKRATALSIYSTGIYIGILLGFVIGGIIAKTYGWRTAFYALGIPGVLYALVVYFTIKEPKKGMSDKTGTPEKMPTIKEVLKVLTGKKTFVFIAFASGIQVFANYGVGNFMPSFLLRLHGMDIAQIGITLGLTTGIGGGLGTFLGGYLADRLRGTDIRWYLWIAVVAALINFVPSYIVFFSPNINAVIICIFLFSFLTAFYLGPTIAVTHSLVNAKMRAFASAILFFMLNIIGLGLGPLTIGMLSDWLEPTMGVESLRWAFTSTFVTGAVAALLFYLGARNYKKDLEMGN